MTQATGLTWNQRNPERVRELKRQWNARRAAEKRIAEGRLPRFPLRILPIKGGPILHEHNQRNNRFCRSCRDVRQYVFFPLGSEVCFDCVAERACRACGEVKPVEGFHRKGRGWRSVCRDCNRARTHERKRIKRQAVYEREGGRCYLCGLLVGEDFHLEHLFPRSSGGTDDLSNLAIAHPLCNLRKSSKVIPVQLRLS